MFQTVFRMFKARTSYRRMYAAIRAIQVCERRRQAAEPCNVVALTFSSLARQFVARGFVQHSQYRRAVRGFRRLQAQWRGSFCKKSYKNLKYQIVRVQSRARGFLSRKQTVRWAGWLHEMEAWGVVAVCPVVRWL